MREANKMALIVAYFLSRFDQSAYDTLGFDSQREAHEFIGNVLGVNPNSIKI